MTNHNIKPGQEEKSRDKEAIGGVAFDTLCAPIHAVVGAVSTQHPISELCTCVVPQTVAFETHKSLDTVSLSQEPVSCTTDNAGAASTAVQPNRGTRLTVARPHKVIGAFRTHITTAIS